MEMGVVGVEVEVEVVMDLQVEMGMDLEMWRGERRGVVRQKLAHRFADDLRVALRLDEVVDESDAVDREAQVEDPVTARESGRAYAHGGVGQYKGRRGKDEVVAMVAEAAVSSG